VKQIISFIILALGLSLVLISCSKQEDERVSSESNPTKNMVMVNVDPSLVKAGQKLYQQNCVFCHQADAIGKPGFAPSLTNQEFLSVASDAFLATTIKKGRAGTGMPPFAHLKDEELGAIIAFLRDHEKLPNISAAVDAQPRSQGDERLGQFWFDSICATCHGVNGDGYVAGGTGTAIGKASFLEVVSDGFLRETIKKGRSNTRMIGYSGPEAMAALSDEDVDDVIAYLRTVPSKN